MVGRTAFPFGIALLWLSLPVSAGATIPAPSNGATFPVAPISLASAPPPTIQPVSAVQTQPDPAAAWTARMVRACVKVGNRMSC